MKLERMSDMQHKKCDTEKEQRKILETECEKKGLKVLKEQKSIEQAYEGIVIAASRDRISNDPLTTARTVFTDED